MQTPINIGKPFLWKVLVQDVDFNIVIVTSDGLDQRFRWHEKGHVGRKYYYFFHTPHPKYKLFSILNNIVSYFP